MIASNKIKLIIAGGGTNAKKIKRLIRQHRGVMTTEQLLDQSDGYADQICEDILREFQLINHKKH